MLKRLKIQNYRCFKEAEFEFGPSMSELLLGKNGAGKSTLLDILCTLHKILDGDATRADNLFNFDDLYFNGREGFEISIEFVVQVNQQDYEYGFTVELDMDRRVSVVREFLTIDAKQIFERNQEGFQTPSESMPAVSTDMFGLRLIPLASSKAGWLVHWFNKALFISPIPSLMKGESSGRVTMRLTPDCSNFADWFTNIVNTNPTLSTPIIEQLKLRTEFTGFQNDPIGETRRLLRLVYTDDRPPISFAEISDGEKVLFLGAVILALVEQEDVVSFCFWDEPENFLSLHEVQHFIVELRKMGRKGSQFIATSHHPETIGCFAPENTRVLRRSTRESKSTLDKVEDLETLGDTILAHSLGELYD